jgi:membrane-associated phospholipid phosphatase
MAERELNPGAAAIAKRMPFLASSCSKTRGICRLAAFFALALFSCTWLPAPAAAVESVFTSGAAVKQEFSRLADEGKTFVTAPVDPYLVQSAAVAGAFALTYVFDKDIRSDLAGAHSKTLKRLTNLGSIAGDPYIHLGVTALLYGASAAADSPRYLQLSQEIGEALVLADGTTFVLKEAIGRGRPSTGDSNSNYRPFQFKTDYDSLSSMHTASSFAIAHVLATKTQSLPVKILCYAAAGFVGFSRLYQEKHWASDLVLGAAIGELAGDSVTRYYAGKTGGLSVAPVAVGGTPALALLGRF